MYVPEYERHDEDAVFGMADGTTCTLCLDRDPHTRAAHHLHLVKQGGIAVLKEHCAMYYAQSYGPRERQEAIDDLVRWANGLMEVGGGYGQLLADPDTGAWLPWYLARAACLAGVAAQYHPSRGEAAGWARG